MNLGFNLSITGKSLSEVKQEISKYYKVNNGAIELSLTKLAGILEFPFEDIYEDLIKFKYISLHLPVISGEDPDNKEFLTYPNKDFEPQLETIKKIANDLKIKTYVLHPDQVKDFNWAQEEFGELLGFENMDSKKGFGKTINEMKEVFRICPKAKWIFDVNHLYTNDKSMQSARQFYETFKARLTHYHVSAFGGFHSSFTKNPNELVILKGVVDISYPLIHEGYKYGDHSVQKEYELINQFLQDKN